MVPVSALEIKYLWQVWSNASSQFTWTVVGEDTSECLEIGGKLKRSAQWWFIFALRSSLDLNDGAT